MRVLVVDDDAAILEVVQEALSYASYEVKTMSNSDTVFDEIDTFRPDIILMDYILEGINGGEICHQIKMNPNTKELPVILISGYGRVLNSLGTYGSDAIIEKPFGFNDLLLTVEANLNKKITQQ